MKNDRRSSWNRPLRFVGIAAVALVLAGGLVIADTLNRPLDVQLRTTIEIYRESGEGEWKRIDVVGPTNARFDASLLEMARGQKIGSGFVLQARSKEGKEYSARLAEDADVDFNPATGRLGADIVFEVGYDGKSARVIAQPTTESRFGPEGQKRGRRAEGVLGRGPTTFTLVSVNELQLDGEEPMILVTQEEYRMLPKEGRGGRGR